MLGFLGGVVLRRLLVVIALASLIGGMVSAVARADTRPYWGYNNLQQYNPPSSAQECNPYNEAGNACSGMNNFDRSQIDYQSGSAYVLFGFLQCWECSHVAGIVATYSEVWTVIRTDWNADHPNDTVPHYNRGICHYDGPTANRYAYIQCRMIIF